MSGTSALLALAKRQVPSWTADKQHIQIGGLTLPRKTRTPYKIKGKNEYYLLESIVFLLESEARSLKPAQYLQDAMKEKIQPVNPSQRNALLSYLRGEVATTPDLDIAGLERLEAATEESKEGGDEGERAGKRQRIGEEAEAVVKPVAEWNEEDIAREELPLATHLSVLQVPKKNLTSLLEMYQRAVGEVKSRTVERDLRHKREQAAKTKAPLLNPKDPNYGIPIIIVPAALSAVINMYNAKQLLENGIFESGERNRVEKGVQKESLLTLHRASFYDAQKSVRYHVIDDVTQLKGEADWHRVVAVFVSGAAWQFADWPKDKWANPAAIFENVCAFHLHFDDEQLHQNILQWRTHRLPISKNKRHGDRSVVLDFWHILNEFVAARNTVKKLNI